MKTISGSEPTVDSPAIDESGQPSPPTHLFPVLEMLFADAGLFAILTVRFVKTVFQPPYEINEFLKQSYLGSLLPQRTLTPQRVDYSVFGTAERHQQNKLKRH
ncbi:MAG: hypothetical protein H6Q31_2650 [Bacteroidetes bacterium]|jgi:hypothetical protein|nr:hypothetical protein [Bacteroidota bacterium]MBP1658049.1 hypothetical protein [Bacteroidota bacterium]